ncbi:caspase family protein [Streptomyces sp. NBC_01276]|uniref:caspase family protein n=1 Tax=Streptomyces sp. NBC_01276 TaxID=2903808 RepID=UPI002F917829
MTAPRYPHGPSSRAVLIGASRFADGDLPAIPAVRNDLDALHRALTHPRHGLLAPEHCHVLSDPGDQRAVGAALERAAGEAVDMLLVYYAGHGLLDDDGRLHLALTGTDPARPGFTSVPLELVQRDLARARAHARVLLLDCCFSGRAVAAMAGPHTAVAGQVDLTGTYTLTSTTSTAPSHAPPGARHTAFTAALLDALAREEPLTLDGIYRHVDRELAGLGLPRPQRRSVNAAGDLGLVTGPAVVDGPQAVPAPTVGDQYVLANPRRSPLQRAGLGLLWLAVLSAPVTWLVNADLLAVHIVPALILIGRPRRYDYALTVDGSGLTMRDGPQTHHIPWQDIEYVGILGHDPRYTEEMGIVLVRLRPHVVERLDALTGLPSLPGWLYRRSGSDFRRLGYVNFCKLSDIGAIEHSLKEAVVGVAGKTAFRSDRELIEQDHRLASPHP